MIEKRLQTCQVEALRPHPRPGAIKISHADCHGWLVGVALLREDEKNDKKTLPQSCEM